MRAEPIDFSPALLRIQDKPPAPLAGWMLRLLAGFLLGVFLWAVFVGSPGTELEFAL